jgi:hypothetical protein
MILWGLLELLSLLDPLAVHQAGALAVVRVAVYGDGVSFAGDCMLVPTLMHAAYLVEVSLRATPPFARCVHLRTA